MNIEEFLTLAAKEEASDLFIVAGLPLTMKVNGVMRRINEEKMMPQDTEKIIREIYEKALDRDIDQLLKTGDDDFSFAIPGLSRFRVSAYKQRGSLAAVIRVIASCDATVRSAALITRSARPTARRMRSTSSFSR